MSSYKQVTEKPANFARRVFSAEKIIKDSSLNYAGLQVFRIVAARSIQNLKLFRQAGARSGHENQYLRNGFCMIENFLPEDQFKEVIREFNTQYSNRDNVDISRPDEFGLVKESVKQKSDNTEEWRNRCPVIYNLVFTNQLLLDTLAAVNGVGSYRDLHRKGVLAFNLERVYPCSVDDQSKEVKANNVGNFHSDTFHSITKCFYHLTDTGEDNTPFGYCVSSHNLSMKRLIMEYRNSIGIQEGAPRIDDEYLVKLGFKKAPMCCSANTMVLANTFGIHARGRRGTKGQSRDLIHIDYRANPFF